jgi:hypothetical protein
MSRSYTSSPPSASMACSGTALLIYIYLLCPIKKYTGISKFPFRALSVAKMPSLCEIFILTGHHIYVPEHSLYRGIVTTMHLLAYKNNFKVIVLSTTQCRVL